MLRDVVKKWKVTIPKRWINEMSSIFDIENMTNDASLRDCCKYEIYFTTQPLRKSAPWSPNMSDSCHVSLPLRLPRAKLRFRSSSTLQTVSLAMTSRSAFLNQKDDCWLAWAHATVEWYLFHGSSKNGYAKVSFRMIIFVSSGEGIKCSKKYGKYEFIEGYLQITCKPTCGLWPTQGDSGTWFYKEVIFGMVLICGPAYHDFIEGLFLIQIWCHKQSPHPANTF
jgi:hypothetical protein